MFDPISEGAIPFDPIAEGAEPVESVSNEPNLMQRGLPGLGPIPTYAFGTPAQKAVAVAGPAVGIASLIGPLLTKAGTAGLAEQAAQRGREIPWEQIQQKAQQGVSRFGNLAQDTELRDTLNAILSRIKPNTILGQEAVSSPEALNIRRQLLARYSPSIIEKLFGSIPLESKVAGAVRGSLSELLHQAAPATRLPDKLYSLYSKGGVFGGDVPTLALKYGLGIPLIKNLLGPIGGAIKNAVQ